MEPTLIESGHTIESTVDSSLKPGQPRQKYARIKIDQKVHVLTLHAQGLTCRDIAKTLGLSHQRVSDITKAVQDYKDAARDILESHAKKAATAWTSAIPKAAKKGDHRPARDLLIATGVISPTESTSSGVTVVVNMPQESPRSVGSATTLEGVFVMPQDAE
jgi:hypothetical protein